MYFTYDKTTVRSFSYVITALYSVVLGLYSVITAAFLIFNLIYGRDRDHMLGFIIGVLLIWAEFICTIMTFNPSVCDGPNSALLNLPLLAVDLTWVVIGSNTIFALMDRIIFIETQEDPDKWRFVFSDVLRSIAFIVVIFRYVGLAWTDHNFFLKRLIAPVRKDKVKEFSNTTFGQIQDS